MKLIAGITIFILISLDITKYGVNSAVESQEAAGYDVPPDYHYIKDLIEELTTRHPIMDIILYIYYKSKGADSIFGYVALHTYMQRENKLEQWELAPLAFYMKGAMESLQNKTSQGYKAAERLKGKFPKSIRTLAFGNCRLIKRDAKDEDLYAPMDHYKSTPTRRRIFTWISNETQPNERRCWSAMLDDSSDNGAILIRNTNNTEYLYAAQDVKTIGKNYRAVFTWVPGTHDSQSRWRFEAIGEDQVYIKNVHFVEYLSTDDNKKFDKLRRYVYTDVTKNKTKKSLWKIVDGGEEKGA